MQKEQNIGEPSPNCCKLMLMIRHLGSYIQSYNFVILQNALLQHVKRAVLQTGIWTTCIEPVQNIPSPVGWGWSDDLGSLSVVWMTIAEAARACSELIKCCCKSPRGCTTCKCIKAGLSCTDLCNCNCEIRLV